MRENSTTVFMRFSSSLCRLAVPFAFVLVHSLVAQDSAAQPPPAALEQPQVKGLHRLYRVNEHIYRSAQPTQEGLESLPALGIKTVIDLRGPSERSGEAQLLESLGIKYVNIPMPPMGSPSVESVKQALALLDDERNWPILVHCKHGVDRTGTVIACFRISEEGWSNQRALDEARLRGLAPTQTAKKHFILNWPAPATGNSQPAHVGQVKSGQPGSPP
jgi:protein-tyrosine phosphatase